MEIELHFWFTFHSKIYIKNTVLAHRPGRVFAIRARTVPVFDFYRKMELLNLVLSLLMRRLSIKWNLVLLIPFHYLEPKKRCAECSLVNPNPFHHFAIWVKDAQNPKIRFCVGVRFQYRFGLKIQTYV